MGKVSYMDIVFLKRTIKVTKKYNKNYIIIRKGLRFLRDEYYLETV